MRLKEILNHHHKLYRLVEEIEMLAIEGWFVDQYLEEERFSMQIRLMVDSHYRGAQFS